MTFASPAWLALLAALPLVLALHLRRRRSRRVSSVLLWSRLPVQPSDAGSRGRLQLTWPLILQLLVLILISLALSGPILGSERPASHAIFVIDTSASMFASHGEDSRFEIARDLLLADLERILRDGSVRRVSVLATAPARYLALDVGEIALAIDEVERLEASPQSSDWPAVEKLVTRASGTDGADVFLIGDEEPEWLKGDFTFRRVRDDSVNLALSEVSLKRVDGNGWRVNVQVRRYGAGPSATGAVLPHSDPAEEGGLVAPPSLTIDFRPEGTETSLRWRELALEFDGDGTAHFQEVLELPGDGYLRIGLPADAFELDNSFHVLVHPEGAPFEVLAVGEVDPSILRALAALPGARVKPSSSLSDDSALYDLVLVGGHSLQRHPGTSTLWLGAGAESSRIVITPELVRVDQTHPLTSPLDLAALRITEAQAVEPVPGAKTLLSAGSFPLLQVRHSTFGTDVFLAFEPRDSNWTELSSFPVFVAALAKLVAPEAGGFVRFGCFAGHICRLDPRVVTGHWPLIDSKGEPLEFPTGPELLPLSALSTAQLSQPGLYRAGPRLMPVNFVSPAESAAFGPLEKGGANVPFRRTSLVSLLFALGLGLLLIELTLAIRQRHLFLHSAGLRPGRTVRLQFLLRGIVLVLLVLAALQVPIARSFRPANKVLLLESGDHLTGTADRVIAELTSSARRESWLIVEGGTRPLASLDQALARVPGSGVEPEILLASSGSVGQANAAELANTARKAGARLSLLPLPAVQSGDVLVSDAYAPHRVEVFRPFEISFTVSSTGPSTVGYRLLRDGEPLSEGRVRIAGGDNRLQFERTEEDAGSHLYVLEVDSDGDPVPANNRGGAAVRVDGGPRVAIFASERSAGERFGDALAIHGVEAEVLNTDQFPHYLGVEDVSLRAWLDYDLVVLMNVPALELNSSQQDQLADWVSEFGGGLLVLGGPNSFGPGGYYGTRLEELLPLSTQVPKEKAAVAIAFVIDRSGSMRQPVDDVQRLEIAKAATREAIGLLDERSQVAVIAFDATAHTVVPLQNPSDTERINSALAELAPGGGTSIYPGLESAFAELLRADAEMSRHIVLMTDGLSQPGEFESLVARIRSAGITVSTAAIGEGADASLVQDIARWGNGSSHVTRDFQALPSILAQEALLLSDDPVQQTDFLPAIGTPGEFTRNLALPNLHGYVLTTERPEAVVHYYASKDAPLLASWRYGLGRVAAFTAQGAGPWVQEWMKLESYPMLWAQLVRWLTPSQVAATRVGLTVRETGEGLKLVVATDQRGWKANVSGPDGASVHVELERDVPGRSVANVPTWGNGVYSIAVSPPGESAHETPLTQAVFVSYPGEFDFSKRSFDELVWLSDVTGGSTVDRLPELGVPEVVWLPSAAWRTWGLLAALLFLAELAIRYTKKPEQRRASVRRRVRVEHPRSGG